MSSPEEGQVWAGPELCLPVCSLLDVMKSCLTVRRRHLLRQVESSEYSSQA